MSPRDTFEEDNEAMRRVQHRVRMLPSEHPEMIVSDEEAERIAREDPNVVRMVMRYHGERHDLSQRIRPDVARGRAPCSMCGHLCYFDDRPHMQRLFPERKLCVACALQQGVEDGKTVPPEIQKMMTCPTYCRWAQEQHASPNP